MATAITAFIVAATALLARLPFLRFPMDEDFAFYTYRARFAAQGLKWKKDVFLIYPAWKIHLMDAIYGGDPAKGVVRVRLFLAAVHVATAMVVGHITTGLTGSLFAGGVAGVLYGLFAAMPSLVPATVNMEQLYLPFVMGGIYLLLKEEFVWAGLCFGLASIPKIATGIYIPLLALAAWWQFGLLPALWFGAAGAAAGFGSRALDTALGYLDAEAKRQYATRYAVAVRLGALKRKYGSIRADLRQVFGETLPVWLVGLPALVFIPFHPQTAVIAVFLITTIMMVLFQQGFSRYHYLPLVAAGCVATGFGLVHSGVLLPGAVWAIFIAALLKFDAVKRYFFKPLEAHTLSHYDKFDQYLHLPRFGAALGRLMRMRKERGRIFVWGNYTQLYHYTGMPAADAFIHYAIGPWDDERLAGYYDTVIGGLVRHKPLYVVKTFPNLDMAALEELTGLRYRLVTTAYARFPLYRLEQASAPARDPLALQWEEKLQLFERLTAGEMVPGVNRADMAAGHGRRAIKECRKALRSYPEDKDTLDYLDALYGAEGTGRFEKMLANAPKTRHVRLILARRAMEAGRMEEASRLIEEEAALFRPDRRTEALKACYYEKAGEHQFAGGMFWKLVREEPENPDLALHLAFNMERTGETANARTIYAEAAKLAYRPLHAYTLIRAAEGIARMDNAPLSGILAGYGAANGAEEVRYALASALEREGKTEEAAAQFASLAAEAMTAPVRGGALFRLARRAEGAERERLLRECLHLIPGHAAAAKMLKGNE